MMETHHFYRKNAKIFLAVAPTSGWKQKVHGRYKFHTETTRKPRTITQTVLIKACDLPQTGQYMLREPTNRQRCNPIS